MESAATVHRPGDQGMNPQILEAQRALGANISDGLTATNAVNQDLQTRATLEPLGSDAVSHALTPTHTQTHTLTHTHTPTPTQTHTHTHIHTHKHTRIHSKPYINTNTPTHR